MQVALVALLAVAGVSSVNAASCSDSDLMAIRQCYMPFFAGYNITLGSMGWPSYWPFHDFRSAMLTNQGIDIQPYVCQLGNALVSCTANISCLDSMAYMALGSNATDSPDYWTDLKVTAYQCGAGYDILMRDFYCIGQCRAVSATQLDQCSNDMAASIGGGGDRCKAYNTFVTCESVIYAGCCGHDAGVFMCGNNQAGINAGDPSCMMNGQLYDCPKPSGMARFRAQMKAYQQKLKNRKH